MRVANVDPRMMPVRQTGPLDANTFRPVLVAPPTAPRLTVLAPKLRPPRLPSGSIRRELSFNLCFYNRNYNSLAALPNWAKQTLDKHRNDRRHPVYSYEELERAETHDDVWNLAQRQLIGTGVIHNYLRMLWGKKIIEWSETPEEAHAAMVRLHDVYALDGRDPNTHAGILWCFGKHDRPWAPERPIFGTIRWMSSEQTRRKMKLGAKLSA